MGAENSKRTLRGLMTDAGVTQDVLAKALKMNRTTLNRKMIGNAFSRGQILAICQFFNIRDPVLIVEIFLPELSYY